MCAEVNASERCEIRPYNPLSWSVWPIGTVLGGNALPPDGRTHDLAFRVRVLAGATLARRATFQILSSTV